MSGTQNSDPGGLLDILSSAEEDVLAGLRTLVAEVRALGAGNELERLIQALASSGGSVVAAGAEGDAVTVKLGEVHVSLRAASRGIEVSFPGNIR
jgi:hypothetical protein